MPPDTNNLICYYTPSDTTNYHITIFQLIQQTIILPYSYWYNNLLQNFTPLLTMNKATARPLLEEPRGCAHQEWPGGRQAHYPRLWILCYYIVFSCFAICVNRYPHHRRPISREDAHWCIHDIHVFFCLLWFTAHSPTNLCEKGWGYHCCVLVWLLALLLN